jgi:hypothetical protein
VIAAQPPRGLRGRRWRLFLGAGPDAAAQTEPHLLIEEARRRTRRRRSVLTVLAALVLAAGAGAAGGLPGIGGLLGDPDPGLAQRVASHLPARPMIVLEDTHLEHVPQRLSDPPVRSRTWLDLSNGLMITRTYDARGRMLTSSYGAARPASGHSLAERFDPLAQSANGGRRSWQLLGTDTVDGRLAFHLRVTEGWPALPAAASARVVTIGGQPSRRRFVHDVWIDRSTYRLLRDESPISASAAPERTDYRWLPRTKADLANLGLRCGLPLRPGATQTNCGWLAETARFARQFPPTSASHPRTRGVPRQATKDAFKGSG